MTGSADTPTISTIGFEGQTVEALVSTLQAAGIEVLVDVRQNAVSRKPAFAKRRLREVIEAAGMTYRHESKLGNPKANRDAYRAGTAESRDVYMDRLYDANDVFMDITALALTRPLALLGFEAEPADCHRTLIADQATKTRPQLSVRHLRIDGPATDTATDD